jgi:hypothetical protein
MEPWKKNSPRRRCNIGRQNGWARYSRCATIMVLRVTPLLAPGSVSVNRPENNLGDLSITRSCGAAVERNQAIAQTEASGRPDRLTA